MNTLNFKSWLRDNTSLSEGSINVYARTISNFFYDHKEISIEGLNSFISKNIRSRNNYYMKYAFRHYLDFIGKPEMYKELVKVKIPSKKKLGSYVSPEKLKHIVAGITLEKYRDVAAIQYATASRARGILTLHEDNIDWDFSSDVIRLRLIDKGDKEHFKFLKRSFEVILKKYLGKGYLFLPKHAAHADQEDEERIVSNERAYYYNAVRSSAEKIGILNFGTHDFRRNAAEMLIQNGADVRTIKDILGHADITTTMEYFNRNSKSSKDAMLRLQKDD